MAFIKPCERTDDHEAHSMREEQTTEPNVIDNPGHYGVGGQICPGVGAEGLIWWHNPVLRPEPFIKGWSDE